MMENGNINARTQLDYIDGVYFGSSGLGVKIPSYQDNSSDDSDIDGATSGQDGTDYDEGILFSFNQVVDVFSAKNLVHFVEGAAFLLGSSCSVAGIQNRELVSDLVQLLLINTPCISQ